MVLARGALKTVASPNVISTTIRNSRLEWPVAISGPTRQPCRGDSLRIVAVTGPGEMTAAIAITNEKTKTEIKESVDNF